MELFQEAASSIKLVNTWRDDSLENFTRVVTVSVDISVISYDDFDFKHLCQLLKKSLAKKIKTDLGLVFQKDFITGDISKEMIYKEPLHRGGYNTGPMMIEMTTTLFLKTEEQFALFKLYYYDN